MDKGGEHLHGARDRHPEEMTASTELVAAVGTRHRSIVRLPWTSQAEAQAHDLKRLQAARTVRVAGRVPGRGWPLNNCCSQKNSVFFLSLLHANVTAHSTLTVRRAHRTPWHLLGFNLEHEH